MDKFKGNSKASFKELQDSKSKSTALRQELIDVRAENELLVKKLRKAESINIGIRQTNSYLQSEITQLGNQLLAIYSSYSWRITRPLRKVVELLIKLSNITRPRKVTTKMGGDCNNPNTSKDSSVEIMNSHIKIDDLLRQISEEVSKQKKSNPINSE